ncbi:MAG: hypothetical protein JNG86_04060 [Verrucomicrobiaceae bacterium]|nr:hypothetical protein [Verrucomicrobiaceae bacterium]
MSFDPNKPAQGSPNSSAEMRGQLNGLKDLIDALQSITAAQVDGVTTLNPGDAATVSLSVIGNTLHFLFGIPQGVTGAQGGPGQDGGPGPVGPQGPPFAQAVVDGVTTLDPGQNATVTVSFDGNNVHFNFSIPRGDQGQQGPIGLPGEVSQTELNNGLANTLAQTSANSNAVATLDTPMADPNDEALRQADTARVRALRRRGGREGETRGTRRQGDRETGGRAAGSSFVVRASARPPQTGYCEAAKRTPNDKRL